MTTLSGMPLRASVPLKLRTPSLRWGFVLRNMRNPPVPAPGGCSQNPRLHLVGLRKGEQPSLNGRAAGDDGRVNEAAVMVIVMDLTVGKEGRVGKELWSRGDVRCKMHRLLFFKNWNYSSGAKNISRLGTWCHRLIIDMYMIDRPWIWIWDLDKSWDYWSSTHMHPMQIPYGPPNSILSLPLAICTNFFSKNKKHTR